MERVGIEAKYEGLKWVRSRIDRLNNSPPTSVSPGAELKEKLDNRSGPEPRADFEALAAAFRSQTAAAVQYMTDMAMQDLGPNETAPDKHQMGEIISRLEGIVKSGVILAKTACEVIS